MKLLLFIGFEKHMKPMQNYSFLQIIVFSLVFISFASKSIKNQQKTEGTYIL